MTDSEISDDESTSLWIIYALAAAFFFTLCNASISEIT